LDLSHSQVLFEEFFESHDPYFRTAVRALIDLPVLVVLVPLHEF
jgi:hypothetical protein